MDDAENKDTYVSQLKEVFDSCDTTGSGSLNESELLSLCEHLHLSDSANFLVHHLLQNEPEVKFEEFKECFVAVLTQSIPNEDEDGLLREDNAEREVSPKFTLGRKKYGRRSRPASVADDDGSSSSSPVISPQNSTDESLLFISNGKKISIGSENIPNKRPMSPNNSNQPPSKSGRMTNDEQAEHQEEPILMQHTSDSDPELNQTFDNNPVQYLQETWKKLGIGQDGYLNVEELALVCEHIGMDMTDEVIAQLFENLDCDQDGQISFEEFLQGLFQHGEPQQNCDSPIIKPDTSKSHYNENIEDHQISSSCVSGIFSCIDPNNTGYAEATAILELWESLELPCSQQCLLEELGYNINMKVNLSDLTSVLEDLLANVLTSPLLQLAFLSYQNEVQYLRQTIEQMGGERRKLRVSVEEANARAALLAQEVDDNHAKLESSLQNKLQQVEKKYQEQARELLEELKLEREGLGAQMNKLKQQFAEEMAASKLEDSKMRMSLSLLEQDNVRLEQELHELTEKHLETEKLNELFQKEFDEMSTLKAKLADLESSNGELQELQHQSLLLELDKYKNTNQALQDKIDELVLEVESLQQQGGACEPSANVNRTHSWLSDYRKAAIAGYKRRGSESSTDENSDDENPGIAKMRKTLYSHEVKPMQTLEVPVEKITRNGPFKPPSPMDVLLKDMLVDQSEMARKLQVAEEKQLRAESLNKQLKNKCRMLNKLLLDLTHTVVA